MPFRYALLLLAVLLAAPAAHAQTYVEFFEVPGDPPLHGLDYHDGFLWAAVRSSDDPRLLQIDPTDGAVVATIPLAGDFSPLGVTWDGANFRVSESFTGTPEVFTVSPTGEVLGQIPAPSQLSNGLTFHNGTLFVAKAYPDEEAAIVGVDPDDGSVLETIPFPLTQPGGIAFLGDGTLWTTNVGDDGSDLEVLWQLDAATGDILDTLNVPTDAGRPRGLAYDDAQFLYAVMDEPGGFEDVIYKIDLSTEGTPVYSSTVSEINFVVTIIGTEQDGGFSFQNTGDAPLEISNVEITGPDADLFTTSFDDRTVPPGSGVLVVIYFAPEAYGPHSATLSFETNDVANEVIEIPLSALGVFPEQQLGFAEAGHDFGEVRIEDPYDENRSERLWPLRLINQGVGALTVEDVVIEGSDAFFVFDDELLPLSIATADTATVHLGFRPNTVGAFQASVFVESNSAGPSVEVTLAGEGIDPDLEGGDALWTLAVPDNPATGFDDKKVTHLAPAGDLTGDGKTDLIVGTENYWVFAVNGNGWGTGDVLWAFNTCPNNNNCGAISGGDGGFETSLVTGSDINDDGTPDVLFSTDGGSDHVYALSGADGSVLWEVGDDGDPYLASYYSLSARFDVTGDGVPDVLTGTGSASASSPNPYNHRRVYALDGASGDERWSVSVGLPTFVTHHIRRSDGGVLAVAGGGDESTMFVRAYNAEDGQAVWSHTAQTTPFVMAPYPRQDGGEDLLYTGLTQTSNRLVRLDAATGEPVWERGALAAGWAVTVPGDLDGDGIPDIVGGFSSGELIAFDGEDGTTLWSVAGLTQVFGADALRDVTGDGIPDIAAATGDGLALLVSGEDGSEVWSYTIGNGSLDQAAEVVAVLPDLDGNHAPEIAVGSRHGRVALLLSTDEMLPTSDEPDALPLAFALRANYPNPFAASTTIRYALATPGPVTLTIYDLLGRPVRTLVAGNQPAGTHEVTWDGTAASGAPSAAGVYLYRFQAGDFSETRRMVLIR